MKSPALKIIFFGSSDFSIPALKACLELSHQVLLVVTTPDTKQGRGLKQVSTPVKIFSEAKQLTTVAPPHLKSEDLLHTVRELKPDLFVVSSYGKLIPTSWLQVPSRLALNVHPSLLPKYRGAAPLHWPIIHGEKETGVSIAEVTERLDAGDIFHQIRFPLSAEIDSEKLGAALAELSGEALRHVLEQIEKGTLRRLAQSASQSSYAPKLKKGDGLIHWQQPAEETARRVRGLLPWPTAYVDFQGGPLQILKARPEPIGCGESKPGQLISVEKDGSIRIQTGRGALIVECVRPAARKAMPAADFIRGRRLKAGCQF